MKQRITTLIVLVLLAAAVSPYSIRSIRAQSIGELEDRISQRTRDIEALEKEIAGYQKEINSLNSQASSLSATIRSLELTQKKLAADISVTENKIASKNLEIQRLSSQILDKNENIGDNKRIISKALFSMHELEDRSVPELILGSPSLSGAWDSLESLGTLQAALGKRIEELEELRTDLESNKRASEKAKADLIKLNAQLTDQKKITQSTAAEKNAILKETKQSEAQYQKLLAEKQALRKAFELEVLEYESQLRLAIDMSSIAKTGSGVLKWPLDSIFVTQYFGNTDFATKNPQIYNGKGHTGIDFRASIGTPVKAAMSGTVSGVGNTDLVRGCYSYGKWVMVEHPNGLSTLYAHLSLPSVSKGESVSTGQVIGYSGNTGYSTGPHLHFGVYATQGVQIAPFNSSKNCRGAIIPLADFRAYLNPLSYL